MNRDQKILDRRVVRCSSECDALVDALREAAHALVEVHGRGSRWRNPVLNQAVREAERDA